LRKNCNLPSENTRHAARTLFEKEGFDAVHTLSLRLCRNNNKAAQTSPNVIAKAKPCNPDEEFGVVVILGECKLSFFQFREQLLCHYLDCTAKISPLQ